MENQKPKSIKIIGLLIIIFSAFVIFTNLMGAFASILIGFGGNEHQQKSLSEFNFLEFLLNNYLLMCLFMIFIGFLYLISGIYVRKYKLWANKIITSLSVLIIILLWLLMISISTIIAEVDGMESAQIVAVFNAAFWTIPFALLIWFFNKKSIKKHFA